MMSTDFKGCLDHGKRRVTHTTLLGRLYNFILQIAFYYSEKVRTLICHSKSSGIITGLPLVEDPLKALSKLYARDWEDL